MNCTGPWTRVRATACGVLVTVLMGCSSVHRTDGSTMPGKTVKGSSTAATGSVTQRGLHAGYLQALSYLDQGLLENAQSVLEPLVLANPGRTELHNMLGVLYRRRGMLDKAIGEYTAAIALSERSTEASSGRATSYELHNNLAIAYREHGEFKKAEEAYRKAMALNPNFAPVYYNLGVLYDLYLNQPGEAVRYYRDYERLAGKSQTVDVWIADLEQRTARGAGNAVGQP